MGYCYLRYLLGVLLIIQSSYGILSQCKLNECQPLYPEALLAGRGILPPFDADLKDLCPPFLAFLGCNIEKLQSCELIRSNGAEQNGTVRRHIRVISSVNSLITELCSEDSDLHKGYAASIDCILPITRERDNTCSAAAQSAYNTYKATQRATEVQGEEKSNEMESICMISGYTSACVMGRVHQKCGDVASKTMIGILRRLRGTGFADCQEREGEKLRGQFLDVVEATEQHGVDVSIFREVFATMRKRK